MTTSAWRMLGCAALLALAAPAGACPVCDSDRAVEVRRGVAEELSPRTLAAVGLPFVVVAGVAALVHFAPARREP